MQTVMLKKDFIINNQLSFNSNMTFSPDHNLFMIIASKTDIAVTSDILSRYRKVKNSLSSKSIDIASYEYRLTLDAISKTNPLLRSHLSNDFDEAYKKAIFYEVVSDIKNDKKKQAQLKLRSIIFSRLEYFILFLLLMFPLSNQFLMRILKRW